VACVVLWALVELIFAVSLCADSTYCLEILMQEKDFQAPEDCSCVNDVEGDYLFWISLPSPVY
jgi:hypothetical protein